MPRCLKIRLAHAERNDIRIIHLAHNVKIFADTGGLNLYDCL